LEGKIDLLEQKKKLIEELLTGKRIALEALGKEFKLPEIPSLAVGKELTLPTLPELPTLAPLPDLAQLTKDVLQAKVDLLNEKTKAIDDLLGKKSQLFIPKILAKEVAYPTYGQKEVVPGKGSILESKINTLTNLFDSKINGVTNLIDSKIDSKIPAPAPYGAKGDPYGAKVPAKEVLESKINSINNLFESKIDAVKNLIDSKIDSKIPVATPYGAKVPLKEVIESKVTSFIDSTKICDGKDTIGVPPNSIICADNAQPVILSTTPFTIFVDTRGDALSRGFHFSYNQQVC
jgi:hypothetical protein